MKCSMRFGYTSMMLVHIHVGMQDACQSETSFYSISNESAQWLSPNQYRIQETVCTQTEFTSCETHTTHCIIYFRIFNITLRRNNLFYQMSSCSFSLDQQELSSKAILLQSTDQYNTKQVKKYSHMIQCKSLGDFGTSF